MASSCQAYRGFLCIKGRFSITIHAARHEFSQGKSPFRPAFAKKTHGMAQKNAGVCNFARILTIEYPDIPPTIMHKILISLILSIFTLLPVQAQTAYGFLTGTGNTALEVGIYSVDVKDGQKTGFFLDQKYNRLAIQKLCKDARVLDCFTHTGSFALNAGIAGAGSVIGVDASQLAVDQATENARLNGLEDRVKFICRDVFELLPELEKQGEKFDVVILDPPAFTKSRNSIKNAVKGYREINLRAMKLVKDGGFLATCSCSHFMSYELFTQTIGQAARNVHKRLRQVEYRTQAPDHPILWAADESYYLKFYIFQVCEEK